jgi:DNA repair protein RadC
MLRKRAFRAEIRLTQDTQKELGLRHCPVLANAGDVARAFASLALMEREVLICATVDCKCRLIHWSMLAVGCADRVTMRLGDAFQGAIQHGAPGVILIHNHPSGSLCISTEDLDLTQSVSEAGKLLGYSLLDHVILSREGYRSVLAARRQLRQGTAAAKPASQELEAAEYRRDAMHLRACANG